MTYWDGQRWAEDDGLAAEPPRSRARRRLLGAIAEASLITLLMFGLIVGTALAARGGGNGSPNHTAVTCVIDGNVVTTTGLPTDEVINFMITQGGETSGWVLGVTWEGDWTLTVPDRTGPTTYEFASRTYGPHGTKYRVFSSCSTTG